MKISLEERILTLAAKTSFSVEDKNTLQKLLSQQFDWQYLIDLASLCEILPLIVKNILEIQPDNVVKVRIEQLSKDYQMKEAINNMILWDEFKKILDLTKIKQIPLIPIKGILFNQLLYDNYLIRHTTDIDILIKKDDLLMIESDLTDLSYILEAPQDKERNFCLSRKMHFKFKKVHSLGIDIILEFHWDILVPFMKIDNLVTDFWNNAKKISLCGENMLVLSPEDLLFESIIEVYKDILEKRWYLIKRHLDISQILRLYGDKINWDEFIKRAYRYRIKNLVYYAFYSNKKLLNNTLVPEDVLIRLKPSFIKKILIEKIKIDFYKKHISFLRLVFYFFIAEVILLNRLRVFFLQVFYIEFPNVSFYKGSERIRYIYSCLYRFLLRQLNRISPKFYKRR